MDAGAKPQQPSPTLLQRAIASGSADVAELFLSQGMDVTVQDITDAACGGHRSIVVLLLRKFKPQDGSSVLHLLSSMTQPDENPLHKAAIDLIVEECAALMHAEPALQIDVCDAGDNTALHVASSLSTVQALLKARADVNATNGQALTPLFYASSAAIGNALLDAGADVNHKNHLSYTPALYTNKCDVMATLIARNADVSARTETGDTVLTGAASRGNMDMMRLLLATPATASVINNSGSKGLPALCLAVNKNSHCMVDALLAAGADPNLSGNYGLTPLMLAQDTDMAQHLLDGGADVNACSPSGDTILLHAVGSGLDTSFVSLLLERGADVNACKDNGWNSIMLTVYNRRMDFLQLLLAADPRAELNRQDAEGHTALFLAVLVLQPMIAKLLLDAGASPQLFKVIGFIPLMHCKTPELIKMLVDAAPETVNHTCSKGRGALAYLTSSDLLEEMFTSSARHVDIEVNHADASGDTALHIAMLKRSGAKAVEMLLENGADVFGVGCGDTTVVMKPFLPVDHDVVMREYRHAGLPDAAPGCDVADETISSCLKIVLDRVIAGC
jgi:ankyrin repeat protein